jgi:hypothetical protein
LFQRNVVTAETDFSFSRILANVGWGAARPVY